MPRPSRRPQSLDLFRPGLGEKEAEDGTQQEARRRQRWRRRGPYRRGWQQTGMAASAELIGQAGSQVIGGQGHRRADHPPADIGGKTLAGTAQVHRINPWQIIAPKTELGHGQQPDKENADLHDGEVGRGKDVKQQRSDNQVWQLEQAKQLTAADDLGRLKRPAGPDQ